MSRMLTDRLESPRARFYAACAVGALLASGIFAYFAFGGSADPFRHVPLANFYEVQARSWLDGRWDADPGAYLFERFDVDGRFYTYFGPFPALLRVPFVIFTDSLDGDLSRVAMLLAFVVLLVFASRLSWQVRSLIRGDGPPTRGTLVAAGGFVFVAGCGSTALFLASETWVYHEAILWGIAWSIASYSFLVSYLVEPRTRWLVLACATAAFAYLSRGSVGLGPVAALGLVLLARVATAVVARARSRAGRGSNDDPWWLRLLGLGPSRSNRSWGPVAAATAIPVVLYSYVNLVKFGTLLGTPPYELQDLLAARPSRQAALAANGGSLFGIDYAPTLLLDYFRPDGISFDRLFPWVSFAPPPRIVGGAVFEAVNFSSSVPATSTLLLVLSVFGIVAAVRAAGPRTTAPSPTTSSAPTTTSSPASSSAPATAAVLRIPILGAIAGCVGTFVLAFLEERYQGDFVPLLVLAGAAGLWYVAALRDRRARWIRIVAWCVGGVLAVWSCWATFSLTLLQQRAYGPLVSTDVRAAFIDTQLDVHDVIPGGTPSGVRRGDLPLPLPDEPGTLLVVGECDGLYWSNGEFWHPVESTPRTGRFRMELDVADASAGTLEPVLSATDDRGSSILWLRHLRDGRARLEYQWTGRDQSLIEGVTPDAAEIGQRTGRAFEVPVDGVVDAVIRMDPAGYVGARVDGEHVLSTFAPVANTPAERGVQAVSPRGEETFAGSIRLRDTATPLCERLRDGAT